MLDEYLYDVVCCIRLDLCCTSESFVWAWSLTQVSCTAQAFAIWATMTGDNDKDCYFCWWLCSFIQCLLDALTGVWHSLTVGESRSYFCLALIYGFKVSLLSAVRLASSAVLSSWRGLLSLTAWHLWPGQSRVKSWYPSTWTGCPMKRHSTSFSV